MKEISEILKAYSEAKNSGKKTALATVVKVEGSSYRQPGARMLVTEDGSLTGAISGGCLEGDALRKALLSINQQQNKLITYNTSNDDDKEIGLQLGCNGIVHILFEYIDDTVLNNPMHLLQQLELERKEAVIGTVFSLKRQAVQLGTMFFYRDNSAFLYQDEVALRLDSDIKQVIKYKASAVKKMEDDNQNEILIEYVPSSVSLVIGGAGNDVQPLVKMASLLGWEVTVIDGRATHAVKNRFPDAKNVCMAKPEDFLEINKNIDDHNFFVLMTHNYKYDLAVLQLLLETSCRYIGILGPKSKLNRMFDDLSNKGIELNPKMLNRIYGPIGLDIGAETSEEIALSIVAEIKAVMNGKNGTSLKYKTDKIHSNIQIV
ncbi:XdhC family protein [Flavobacterium sp.]|uniref:XdhC family protein n=1 Tax=Flavobacterium sp. TaxID=239 RepID=UPI0032652BE9